MALKRNFSFIKAVHNWCVCCVYSSLDVYRHVSCEKCTSRANGGYDPINNQVHSFGTFLLLLFIIVLTVYGSLHKLCN